MTGDSTLKQNQTGFTWGHNLYMAADTDSLVMYSTHSGHLDTMTGSFLKPLTAGGACYVVTDDSVIVLGGQGDKNRVLKQVRGYDITNGGFQAGENHLLM